MYSQEFLKILKQKTSFKDNNFIHYGQLFVSIFGNFILRKKLDLYMQYWWFLQRLLKKIVIEIFYQYDIGLKDKNSWNFEDLLEKMFVLIKYYKYLAVFI